MLIKAIPGDSRTVSSSSNTPDHEPSGRKLMFAKEWRTALQDDQPNLKVSGLKFDFLDIHSVCNRCVFVGPDCSTSHLCRPADAARHGGLCSHGDRYHGSSERDSCGGLPQLPYAIGDFNRRIGRGGNHLKYRMEALGKTGSGHLVVDVESSRMKRRQHAAPTQFDLSFPNRCNSLIHRVGIRNVVFCRQNFQWWGRHS